VAWWDLFVVPLVFEMARAALATDGVHRVVLINPEILVQKDGLCKSLLWSNKSFMSKVFNIIFDEGHCISQWGSTFCLEYKLVGVLRFITPGIPFYITSATIPHVMLQDIKEMLHMPSDSLLFQRSND
jgi:ATP-dependent DNA helicase RecQ